MSKHSKNNSSKSVFTNFERSRALGIKSGTEKLRLGHDSMKPFDACSITLEAVVNPVADREGHLYSKSAIYDHVLEQKRLYNTQLKAYKKEQEEMKVLVIRSKLSQSLSEYHVKNDLFAHLLEITRNY
jgi:nitric oxide synthase-interacting protein